MCFFNIIVLKIIFFKPIWIPRWAGICINVKNSKFSSLGIINNHWMLISVVNQKKKKILYNSSGAMFDAGENRKYFISMFLIFVSIICYKLTVS